jgi:hypothetical protein
MRKNLFVPEQPHTPRQLINIAYYVRITHLLALRRRRLLDIRKERLIQLIHPPRNSPDFFPKTLRRKDFYLLAMRKQLLPEIGCRRDVILKNAVILGCFNLLLRMM